MPAAVVLLSGGLDSTTTLAWSIAEGYATYALSVDYGQRHAVELERARQIAAQFPIREHRIMAIDLRSIGGSALTAEQPVPKNRAEAEMNSHIPATYVPARNTILLSLALAYAETIAASDIMIGANVLDYSGYPDCRPEFLSAFESLANLATKAGTEGTSRFRIHAPLLKMTKAEIIRLGISLGVDYTPTLSCYDPDSQGRACGQCDSCLLRRKGFVEAGINDPTVYHQ